MIRWTQEMIDMLKTIHKNIKSRRKELKMTQSDLAEKLGYADKSMIAKIEAGLVDLPQSRIEAFAAALGTTKEALTGWTEERARNSFSYCVEQQMAVIGYNLTYTTEGDVILSYEGARATVLEPRRSSCCGTMSSSELPYKAKEPRRVPGLS